MSEFSVNAPIGVSFIVKNISPAPGKIIYVFQNKIFPGRQLDLMKLRGIGEADIRDALLKGDLGKKIKNGFLQVVSSTLVFPESDPEYVAFLNDSGLTTSVVNNTTGTGGGGGGGSWPTSEPGTVSIVDPILIESTGGPVEIRGVTGGGPGILLNSDDGITFEADDSGIGIYQGINIECSNGTIGVSAFNGNDVNIHADNHIDIGCDDEIDIQGDNGVTLNTHGGLALNVSSMGPITYINMNSSTMNIQSANVNVNQQNNDIFTVNGQSFFTGPVRLLSIFSELENNSLGLSDLVNPAAQGFYEVDVYLSATTPGSGGTVFATINYTDGSGATSQITPTLTFGAPARVSAKFLIETNGIDSITYSTTAGGLAGGALYSIRISITRIG